MKNPKYVVSYPNTHKVKFGGHTMSPWTGYSLELIQTKYGRISADRFRGYQDDVVNLSYTPSAECTFNGWNNVGGLLSGNTITFTDSNIHIAGVFLQNGSYTATSSRYDLVDNNKAGIDGFYHLNAKTYAHGYLQNTTNYYNAPTIFRSGFPSGCFVSYRTIMKANSVPSNSIYINSFDTINNAREICDGSLDTTKIPIYTLGGKISYSSHNLTTDGSGRFYIPGNVTTGTKLHSFICSANSHLDGFFTAYYDGNKMINASSQDYFRYSPDIHFAAGMYQLTATQTTSWHGTSDGVTIAHKYNRYKPLNGSVSSQMRIFSSFNDAERWAKGQ
jgi:hypothetical protein